MSSYNIPDARRNGTWTPTFSNDSNLDVASPVVLAATYMVVGNTVMFQMKLTVDPSASGVTSVDFTLPISPGRNFSGTDEALGVVNGQPGGSAGTVESVDATQTAQLLFTAFGGTAGTHNVIGSYTVR